ncbi:hypothetical protein [Porticoccus sp. Uisw_050_02]|uniref:hypothetical protein n=1 Tax=Porticoccus sp. Uisw_050_02 TaxID=3230978 RepID=UPI0039E9ADB1
MKILLTICLLLITSQVFAKKITVYDCPTEADARSCNNCKKSSYMNIKVNVNTNKVLLQHPESNTNTYLQTVKHEDEWIAKNTNFASLWTVKETLEVFDEDNWEYLKVENVFYTSTNQRRIFREQKESMVNGKYYAMDRGLTNYPFYWCGK